MGAVEIAVDTRLLTGGAGSSGYAADGLRSAAEVLASQAVVASIFGTFDEALNFHTSMLTVRRNHLDQLHLHQGHLVAIADKAAAAAQAFTTVDEHTAAAIDAVATQPR